MKNFLKSIFYVICFIKNRPFIPLGTLSIRWSIKFIYVTDIALDSYIIDNLRLHSTN